MDVNQMYSIVLLATAKNRQDGYVSPDDFYTSINTAQNSYLDYLLGEYQKYQAGRPIPTVALGQTEKIRQSIAPLIYGTVLTPNTTTGIAPCPSDFAQVDAMWSVYGFYNIRFVQQDRQFSYYRSGIDPVVTNPFYTVKWEGLQFYPENIGQARMSYVRNPPSIVWGYTIDSNGIPQWNPLTSQNPVWADYDCLQIIVRALQLLGTNLQLGAVMQYAQEVKNGGQ